jgi:hypothetical protein
MSDFIADYEAEDICVMLNRYTVVTLAVCSNCDSKLYLVDFEFCRYELNAVVSADFRKTVDLGSNCVLGCVFGVKNTVVVKSTEVFDLLCTYKTEDFAERQRICELAVAEYPGDMKWLSDLAWVVSNRSFEYEDNETYIAQQEKAIKLFEAVIKNCSDEILKGEAIIGITQLLGWRGRKDEARKYVEMLPERTGVTREQVLENVLEGEELVEFKQKRILDNIHGALRGLSLLPEESTDAMRALVQAMFPDGDYMGHYLTMYYAVQRQINHRVKLGVLEETIPALLAEMKGYAEKYTEILHKKPGVYRYTTPWFDHIEEDTRDWIGCEAETLLQDFAKYLEHPYFEKMRKQFV